MHALAHLLKGAGECACAPEAPWRADVEFLNRAEKNAGAIDCGGQAGSAAGQVERGLRGSGALLASHAGGVGAAPARCSHRTQAGSAGGEGGSGALLASRRSIVTMRAKITLRRRARGAALANHARSRGLRYGGHSNNSSGESMSKGVALGCLSSGLALVGEDGQPRCTAWRSKDPPGGAGAGGALLRTPWAVRPLAACKVRALPWHGQAGGSGRGAGGAAARRGRIWGACRRGRALQKM